ncbi:MAG TPA: ACT domain-containing protein, partial [Agromyces sp.]
DPLLMQRVIAHGLAASGRYLTVRVGLPDRPGQLVRVAELLAGSHANVVEVLHTRHGRGMQISEVEIDISVETRGPEHRAEVVEVLRRAGYEPVVLDD